MKTQRIKVETGETVELYITKRNPTCQYYSSIALDEGRRTPEQKKVSTGLNATMKLIGPVTLCVVISNK